MTVTAKRSKGWKGSTLLVWTVLGAAVVFILLSMISDAGALRHALRDFPLKLLVPIALLSLGNYALRFVKWHWYLVHMGYRIPLRHNLGVFLSAFALTVSPGKVGEFIKTFILKARHDVPYSVSTAVLVMERLTDVIAIMILSLIGLFLEFLPLEWAVLSLFAVVGFILVLRNRRAAGFVIERLDRLPLLRGRKENLQRFYDTGWSLMSPGILTGSLILSVFAWLLEGIGYYLVAKGFLVALTLLEGVFIYSASLIGGVLTLFVGGLGATEGALVALGLAFGMARPISVASAIIIRVMTLWLAVVIGWLVFLFSPRLRSLLRASSRVATAETTAEQLSMPE